MKYLLVLVLALGIYSDPIKPLALGFLDPVSGITGSSGDCPASLGGGTEEWCFASSKCFDTTCVNGQSANPLLAGSVKGGMLIQVLNVNDCERNYSSTQDSLFVFMKIRLLANQKTCIDSIRGVVNSGQDTTSCFLSVYDQFTSDDKLRLSSRLPLRDSIVSPIALWRYTCSN